jgi:hypothetical protein
MTVQAREPQAGTPAETPSEVRATTTAASNPALVPKRLVPRWVGPVFTLGALALIPWVAYLGASLPTTVRVSERTAWIGFDIGLMAMFALTAVLAYRHSARVAQAATATATMLVVDAWFDIFTSGRGAALALALELGVLEVACAAACVWISLRANRAAAATEPSR